MILSAEPVSPKLSQRYWKQTVFLLPDISVYQVEEKEVLYGVFRLRSHDGKRREKHELLLDLCIRGKHTSSKERITYLWR